MAGEKRPRPQGEAAAAAAAAPARAAAAAAPKRLQNAAQQGRAISPSPPRELTDPELAREAAAEAAGWERGFSKREQRAFWFHKATHRRAWSLEKVEIMDRLGGGSGSGGGSSGGHGGGGGSSSGAAGGSKRSGGGGGSKGSVWKACYSSKRQKTFYVNKLTDERSWHKPPDYDGD